MHETIKKMAQAFTKQREQRRRAYAAFTALAILVSGTTTYWLVKPASTMAAEYTCGLEEHVHSEDCYETVLICTDENREGHTHSEECYPMEYICGEEAVEPHAHGEECYSNICGLEESEGHTHSEACSGIACGLKESEGHAHGDSCYEQRSSLTCTAKEGEGHSHSDACYGNTCGEAETAGHSHDDSCYDEESQLICGESESEGHTHDDSCTGLTCGQEEYEAHTHGEGCYVEESVLVCQEAEAAPHTHDESCNGLICGQEEHDAHTHDESCKSLTCALEETEGHTHTAECEGGRSETPDCGKEECEPYVTDHVHDETCYEKVLICEKKEHEHTEECLLPEQGDLMMVLPEGAEIPEGYDEEYSYIDPDNRFGVMVYAPEGALPEGAYLVAELLEEDSDAYAAAEAAMDAAFDNMAALDIRFERDGREEEPSEPVYVCINAVGLLPETVNPQSVEIHHIKETEQKVLNLITVDTEVSVEVVADGTEDTGIVEASANSIDETMDVNAAFAVDSFSIFVVAGMDDFKNFVIEDATQLDLTQPLVMTVNEDKYLMWYSDKAEDNQADTRGVWAVTKGTDVIEIDPLDEVDVGVDTKTNGAEPTYKYWYVKVTALEAGEAELTFTFRSDEDGNFDSSDSNDVGDNVENGVQTGTQRQVFKVTIQVNDEGYWIDDQVATNGCLVPAGEFARNDSIVSYEWTRSDGVDVSADATSERYVDFDTTPGGVNVAIDKGGFTDTMRREGKPYITYTVKGLDESGNYVDGAEASFEVKYTMEVVNGGFESPKIPDPDSTDLTALEGTDIYRQYSNGEDGLFWMTTGTGSVNDSNNEMLGHDIEVFTDKYGIMAKTYSGEEKGLNYIGTTNGLSNIADYSNNNDGTGNLDTFNGEDNYQAVELNCEEYGALYQDIITTPGATLSWGVSHAARYAPTKKAAEHTHDHMCIIIMSTEDARYIVDKDDVDILLDAAEYNRPTSHDGVNIATAESCGCGLPRDSTAKAEAGEDPFFTARLDVNETPDDTTDDREVKFQIWDSAASYNKWTEKTGTYTVPDNQYSTRFFFAVAVSVTNQLDGGNFIDNVYFTESLPYTIEYYIDGELQGGLTEKGYSPIDDTISAGNMGSDVLQTYNFLYAELNGYSSGTSFRVQPVKNSETGVTENPVLRLYYATSAVVVNKEVAGLDGELSSAEVEELLSHYTVTVDLYSDASCTSKVASAVVKLGGSDTGTTVFVDVNTGKPFATELGKTYYAKEAYIPELAGHTIVTDVTTVKTVVVDEAVEHVTFKNVYEPFGDIVTDKTVEADDNNNLWIDLEAYTTGESTLVTSTKPLDVVFLLDQSSSMHKPEGVDADLNSGSGWGVDADEPDTGRYTREQFEAAVAEDAKNGYENASKFAYWISRSSGKGTEAEEGDGNWWKIQYDLEKEEWVFQQTGRTNTSMDPAAYSDYYKADIYQELRYSSLDEIPDAFQKFYVTQYGRMIESVREFVDALHRNGGEHRVGVVGFAGYNAACGFDGCSYFYGDNVVKRVNASGADYSSMLMEIDSQYSDIMKAVDAVNAQYGGTHTDEGFRMAYDLLKATDPDDDRARIVVLISDGDPFIYTSEGKKADDSMDLAIAAAKNLKQIAKVYTIGTYSEISDNFLLFASSKYPNAESMTVVHDPVEGTYSYRCEVAGVFSSIVQTVTNSVVSPTTSLDEKSILRDVISSNFVLDEHTHSDACYQLNCNEEHTHGDACKELICGKTERSIGIYLNFYENGAFKTEDRKPVLISAKEHDDDCTDCANIHYEVGKMVEKDGKMVFEADPSGNTIQVTGFDYSAHCVTKGEDGGYKIVVRIPVAYSDTNTGGYEQKTNDHAEIEDDDETVKEFPDPYTDAPVTVKVKKIVSGTVTTEEFSFSAAYLGFDGYDEDNEVIYPEGGNYLPVKWVDRNLTNNLTHYTEEANNWWTISDVKPDGTISITETVPDGYHLTVTYSYTDEDGVKQENVKAQECKIDGNNVTYTIPVKPDLEITFTNSTGPVLPSTGGMGTGLYTLLGGLMMACAAGALELKRRRSVAE